MIGDFSNFDLLTKDQRHLSIIHAAASAANEKKNTSITGWKRREALFILADKDSIKSSLNPDLLTT